MKINHDWIWEDPMLNILLEKANRAIGELNAFSLWVPDIDLFIKMHVVKEANTSSRIEGTKTEIDEAVLREDQIAPERRDDWREVHNYIDAMNTSIAALSTLPLSNRLLKDAHQLLMRGVRGEHKLPGEFRSSQNWIGGSSLKDAFYVPPYHTEVNDLMSDLEQFWHNEGILVPDLIRIALSHYQFETIHPFLDGTGRIGRLLITLYLVSQGLLTKPCLYLSDFFERNRQSYYDALSVARSQNNLLHWVKFFLTGTIETAEKSKETFQKIIALRTEAEAKIKSLGKRAKQAEILLGHFYTQPRITVKEVAQLLEISIPSAGKMVDELQKLAILEAPVGQERNRIFAFKQYLDLF